MPIPEYEIQALGQRLCQEFNATPAPYYGINIIEVNEAHWDAFLAQVRIQHASAVALGGKSHLWTVRDHGERKQVCWINYYPKSIGESVTEEVVSSPAFHKLWKAMFDVVERYEWFCTSDVPEGAPS